MTTTDATDTKPPKRAFDFARGNLWLCDPTDDLCIVGGADVLEGDEVGALDTEADETNPLYDERIRVELAEEFVRNIDAFGIITPIVIAKVGDLACVVAGRQRVRAARVVNCRRQRSGQKPITVPCQMRRANDVGLMGAMISENEQRFNDGPLAKLEKFKRFMERGVSVDDAALAFGIKPDTAKGWLSFDDHASARLKKLVADEKITFYAALRIARLKDVAKQDAAIDDAFDGGTPEDDGDDEADEGAGGNGKPRKKVSYSKANKSAKKTRHGHDNDGVGTRDLKKVLAVVVAMPHPNASKETLAWWSGVEAAMRFVLGTEGDVDERLAKALDTVHAAAKAAAKATK